MKKEIFKVQRPIHTNDTVERLLIYNESLSFRDMIPNTPEWSSLFKDKYKIYVLGEVIDGTLIVDSVVKRQPW